MGIGYPLDASSNHCVLAWTGSDDSLLVRMAMEAGMNVWLLNPKQTKYHACMMLAVHKLDQIYAQRIVLYREKTEV